MQAGCHCCTDHELWSQRAIAFQPTLAPSLPCHAALSALRALDLSANRLAGPALLAADFPACGARLTALRLGGNRLADVASWLGPLPSLLHLDVSSNELASLEGLAAAAPLLQASGGGLGGGAGCGASTRCC